MFAGADPFGRQLGFFQLEQLFAAALQGVLERGLQHGVVLQFRPREPHQQHVLSALHREFDSLQAAWARRRASRRGGGRQQLAALEIDKEPGLRGGTPAMIHAQQGGRWCVDQPQHGRPVEHHVGFLDHARRRLPGRTGSRSPIRNPDGAALLRRT